MECKESIVKASCSVKSFCKKKVKIKLKKKSLLQKKQIATKVSCIRSSKLSNEVNCITQVIYLLFLSVARLLYLWKGLWMCGLVVCACTLLGRRHSNRQVLGSGLGS